MGQIGDQADVRISDRHSPKKQIHRLMRWRDWESEGWGVWSSQAHRGSESRDSGERARVAGTQWKRRKQDVVVAASEGQILQGLRDQDKGITIKATSKRGSKRAKLPF